MRPSKAFHAVPEVAVIDAVPPLVNAACCTGSRYMEYSAAGEAGNSTDCCTIFSMGALQRDHGCAAAKRLANQLRTIGYKPMALLARRRLGSGRSPGLLSALSQRQRASPG